MRVKKVLEYCYDSTVGTLLNLSLENLQKYQENIRRILRKEPIEIYLGYQSEKDVERLM